MNDGKNYLKTQLWEECPRCGAEPIYAETNLCERCSPKRSVVTPQTPSGFSPLGLQRASEIIFDGAEDC